MLQCRNVRRVEGGSSRGEYLHHPQNRTLCLDGHNHRRTRSITPFKTIDRGRSLFSLISLSISPNSISALFWALVAPRTLALMLGSWALRLGIECSHSFGG